MPGDEQRQAILAALDQAVNERDRVLEIVGSADSANEVTAALAATFDWTEEQAQAVAHLRLLQLSRGERAAIATELERFRALLSSPPAR